MRDYLITLLLVSAVAAVLSLLRGEGATARGVSFALSLLVLSAVVLPLPDLLSRGADWYGDLSERWEEAIPSDEAYWQGVTVEAVGVGIGRHLCERYGLAEAEVSVQVLGDVVEGTVILRHVSLTLSGRAVTADVPAIIRYIEENTGAECEVIYRGDE